MNNNYLCVHSDDDFQKIYPWTEYLIVEGSDDNEICDLKRTLKQNKQITKIEFKHQNLLFACNLSHIVIISLHSVHLEKPQIDNIIQMNHIRALTLLDLDFPSETFHYLFPRLHLLTTLKKLYLSDDRAFSNKLLIEFIDYLNKVQLKKLGLRSIFGQEQQLSLILHSLISMIDLRSFRICGYRLKDQDVEILQQLIDNGLSDLILNVEGNLNQLSLTKSKLTNLGIYTQDPNQSLFVNHIDQIEKLSFFMGPQNLSPMCKNITQLAINLKNHTINLTMLLPLIENQTIKKLEMHFYSTCEEFVKQLILFNQSIKYLYLFIHPDEYAEFDITKELTINKKLKHFSTINVKINIKSLFLKNQRLEIFRYNSLRFDEESLQSLEQNTSLIDIYQSYKIDHFQRVCAILLRNRRMKSFRKQKLSDLCINVLNRRQ